MGNLVAVLVGDGSVQEAVVEVVAPGAGHASGLTAQDVLDDLEVAGPAASLLTARRTMPPASTNISASSAMTAVTVS
ncbi:hypothetical protein [Streptomyces sp. NBC_01589]|uniref:hypothetical protein n=1 Tax=unclassified Streptomyces TaxID=2593676 RepID=UPI00386FC65C